VRLVPWFWHVCHTLVVGLMKVHLRVSVERLGEAPAGAVLVCAKHASAWDIPLLGTHCWRSRREIPYFQMGSFVGYPILGRVRRALRWLGGFPVMRPKEVLRLRRKWDRTRIHRMMDEVNAEAERTRREVLRAGRALVVFPEGTRDPTRLLPLRGELEVRAAVELEAEEAVDVQVWPAVVSYGRPGVLGRRVRLVLLEPFPVRGESVEGILRRLERAFADHWLPPEEVTADGKRTA